MWLNPDRAMHSFRCGSRCRLMADFVAEVGDDKSVAAGSNVLS
jgi:hypothetical protein